MSQFNNRHSQTQFLSRRKTRPLWFWLLLTGGSIVAHLALIYAVGAITPQSSELGAEAVMPIDFVELPASQPAPQRQPLQQNSTGLTAASQEASAPKISASLPTQPPPAALSQIQGTTPTKAVASQQPAPLSKTEPPSESQPNSVPAQPASVSQAANQTAQTETGASPLASPPSTIPSSPVASSLPLLDQPASPSPSPSPLIAAQPIDVPVPDVSETLPLPPEVSSESATVTNRIMIPSHLTASLTTDSPSPDSKPELDEAAHPETEVQRFSSNPAASPCLVTSEAVKFLGKTVAMQVATDETGQVLQTVTQESSQSPAYDALATCLVRNWRFEPAIAQGEPIANDGLVVRITIDRS